MKERPQPHHFAAAFISHRTYLRYRAVAADLLHDLALRAAMAQGVPTGSVDRALFEVCNEQTPALSLFQHST
jgi:hypothetical protein